MDALASMRCDTCNVEHPLWYWFNIGIDPEYEPTCFHAGLHVHMQAHTSTDGRFTSIHSVRMSTRPATMRVISLRSIFVMGQWLERWRTRYQLDHRTVESISRRMLDLLVKYISSDDADLYSHSASTTDNSATSSGAGGSALRDHKRDDDMVAMGVVQRSVTTQGQESLVPTATEGMTVYSYLPALSQADKKRDTAQDTSLTSETGDHGQVRSKGKQREGTRENPIELEQTPEESNASEQYAEAVLHKQGSARKMHDLKQTVIPETPPPSSPIL